MKFKTCCFIGHREIVESDELVARLKSVVEALIVNYGVRCFAFGSRSEFNDLCHEIVSDFQKRFTGIERVLLNCRCESCYLESEKEKLETIFSSVLKKEVHLQTFEREIEHKTKFVSGKAAYVERNQALIDMSDFCVFYYDKSYLPPIRKISKFSFYQPKSGTALAFKYAVQKKEKNHKPF